MPMSKPIGSAALAGGLVVTWSSGFVGADLGTRHATADTLLMWRFVVAAGLLGGGWLIWRRARLPARALAEQSAIGLLSQVCYVGPIVWAVGLGVPSGTIALIAALQPLAAGTLAGPLLGERVGRRQWAGLGVGLAGVALVVRGDLAGATAPGWAYALPFGSMAALLAASLLERRATAPLPAVDALPLHCVISALAFSAIAGTTGGAAAPTAGLFWVAIGWVVLLSTVGAYGCYWLVLRRDGLTRTSTLIYLTPPTTALWAYAMWGTGPGAVGLLGMVICVAGVVAATLGTHTPATERTPLPPAAGRATQRTPAADAGGHPPTAPAPHNAQRSPTAPLGTGAPSEPAPVRTPDRPTANARCAAGS